MFAQEDFRNLLLAISMGAFFMAGSDRSFCQTVAWTASASGPYSADSNNGGLNVGHSFSTSGINLEVTSMGVYDLYNDGLLSSHTVSLFSISNGVYTAVPGGSLVIPAGTVAPLINSYRFQTLTNPVVLPPGNYAIIAFQMNGYPSSDSYSEDTGYNSFFGFSGFNDDGSIYEFTTNAGPGFPSPGGIVSSNEGYDLGSASLIYNVQPTAPVISPGITYATPGQTVSLTASTTGTAPISYQWYYGNSSQPIAGATNSTLTLNNIQSLHNAGNAGTYLVSAQNAASPPVFSTGTNNAFVAIIPVGVPPLNILPLGDSITLGTVYGGYRAPLYQLLTSNNFDINYVGTLNYNPTYWMPTVFHDGVSGDRIDQINQGYTTSWVNDIPTPDIILLLAGSNDYVQNYDEADATNRLNDLIDWIVLHQPQTRLIVANMILRTDNAATEAAANATFNPFIAGLVASHAALGQKVSFVDMHSVLSPSDIGSDGIHPNQSGYNKMAPVWYQAITNVFPAPGSTNPVLTVTSTNAVLKYGGVPGFQYLTLRTTNFAGINWLPIATNIMFTNSGPVKIVDGFGDLGGIKPPAALYKLQLE